MRREFKPRRFSGAPLALSLTDGGLADYPNRKEARLRHCT
jgi:hypothetical protein